MRHSETYYIKEWAINDYQRLLNQGLNPNGYSAYDYDNDCTAYVIDWED